MDLLSIFAERLKELMDDNNLNTLSLQKRTGIHNSNISNWLTKKFMPLTRQLITISSCLNCSIDFLVGRAEFPDIKSTELVIPFNERLKFLSSEKGKTLHAVAVDLKMDDAILYNWGNGKYIPNVEGLIMLADYFRCSIDYLLGREE